MEAKVKVNKELEQSKVNKKIALEESELLLKIKSLIVEAIISCVLIETKSFFSFERVLSPDSKKRLTALGFNVRDRTAQFDGRLLNSFALLRVKVSQSFNGANVVDLDIDDESGNVVATINDRPNVNCGLLVDYAKETLYEPSN